MRYLRLSTGAMSERGSFSQMTGIALKRSDAHDSVVHHASDVAITHLLEIGDFECGIEQLGRCRVSEIEAKAVGDALAVDSVVAVVHERRVLLERVVQCDVVVFVSSTVTQTHEMAHPRAKVFKRVNATLVVPAAVAERKQLREGAHDVSDLALKLVDRLNCSFCDA